MDQNQIAIVKKHLQVDGTKVIATSRAVAGGFGRKHKNVIRDIESLEIPEEFNRLNFEPVNYLDAKGENRKMYTMTRDGFTLLVMGYTGKKAMEIKLAYIQAFNEMEAELAARQKPDILDQLFGPLLGGWKSTPRPAIPEGHRVISDDRFIELLQAENSHLKDLLGKSTGKRDPKPRQAEGESELPYYRREVSVTERETIVRMYKSGATPTAIGEHLGRPRGTISALIARKRKAVN